MPVVVLLMCSLLLFLSRRLVGSWTCPVVIFVGIWTLSIAGAFVCFPDARWSYLGVIWIMLCLLATLVGFLGGRGSAEKATCYRRCREPYCGFSRRQVGVLCLSIAIGMSYVAVQLGSHGFSLGSLVNVDSLLEMNPEMAVARYSGSSAQSAIMQILACVMYASAALGGFFYVSANKEKEKLLCVATLLPISCLMVATNAKAGFIGSVFLWISGYLARYLALHKRLPIINRKKAVLVLGIALALSAVFFLTFLLRFGSFDGWAVSAAFDKYSVYAFGEVFNFDHWLAAFSHRELDAGMNTFMGIFTQLGFTEKAAGVYQTIVPGYGNVFSMFRGVIEDFGILGGLCFFALVGAVDGLLYRRLVQNSESNVAPIAYTGITFTYFYSFIISPWIYFTYFVTMLLFLVAAMFCDGSNERSPKGFIES